MYLDVLNCVNITNTAIFLVVEVRAKYLPGSVLTTLALSHFGLPTLRTIIHNIPSVLCTMETH